MSDSELKVNDKRMFTPEGELREEFRHLENAPPTPREEAPRPAPEPPPRPPKSEPEGGAAKPPSAAQQRGVSLADLVGLLAEHAAVYLGERALPDGESMTDLRAAQLHIDLLDVLREKTAGNLTPQEEAMVEDVLYQLRVAYVEKRRRGE
jgi:Domain of unknown function (DUF1844)